MWISLNELLDCNVQLMNIKSLRIGGFFIFNVATSDLQDLFLIINAWRDNCRKVIILILAVMGQLLLPIFPSDTRMITLLQGVPGRTYNLSVIIDGLTYNASSTMPYPVSIDSIYFAKSPFGNDKLLTVKFLDPANAVNYYRLVELINNDRQQRFSVASDRLYQGSPIIFTFPAQGDNDIKLVTGDQITVWLESIDKNVYEYFRTARRDGSQSTSPANSVSNISSGVLGYFSAGSVRKATTVVP